jgi:enoyl-CoA hydratase
MTYQTLVLERGRPIAYLRLRRPESGNLIDGQTIHELEAACRELGDDDAVRAVILTGEGDAFCRGWDLSGLDPERESPLAWARRQGLLGDPFGCLARLPQPVIAAVNGHALSAGLELALACDVRLAAQEARFACPETAHGLIPWAGGTQRLPRIVGRGKALEMILTGEAVDAQEALRIGLVSQVVPRDRLLAEAEALAGRIAARGPIAVRYAKEAVSQGLDMTLEQALRYETDLTIILQTTQDRAEGVRAFLEKRTPKFKGR